MNLNLFLDILHIYLKVNIVSCFQCNSFLEVVLIVRLCQFLCLFHDRVHIRRTDKLAAEASFHSVAEYMTYVEDFFSKLELRMPGVERRVFLASDDPSALPEAKKK